MAAGDRPDAQDQLIEERLDELQRESQERRTELRALAAELPIATSRRAYLTAMVRSVSDAPDKPTVVKRVLRKIARTPADLVRSRRS